MDLKTLIERMLREQDFYRVLNNPMSQFGTTQRPLLGATLLPERTVRQNEYTEQAIRYRSQVANDGTRYSPVQKKRGILTGSMLVQLGHSDIGSELTSNDYDAFIEILQRASGGDDVPTMEAIQALTKWTDLTLRRPMDTKNEIQRWQAIVDAAVVRRGDNKFVETVNFSNPSGHRFNAGDSWSDDTYDPYDDILAGVQILIDKGYSGFRFITSNTVTSLLLGNDKMKERVGKISVAAGTVVGMPGRLSTGALNAIFADDGLPSIEKYDQRYFTATGSARFLKEDVFVIIATTGRDETLIDINSNPLTLQNVIGYQAVGRAAGQSAPGRAFSIQAFSTKPPRVEGEAWQASFPVILDPEAIVVIKEID